MRESKVTELLKKYEAGTLSDKEKLLLESWYIEQAKKSRRTLSAQELETHYAGLKDKLPLTYPPKVRPLWPRIAAAASVLIALSAGGYFLLHKRAPVQQVAQNQVHDIAPGGNKAILTLSNGQKIVLNGQQGQVASQAGKQISVDAKGKVIYTGQADSKEVIYNTITVPIGNSRDLTLPDGTEVSLDAGSSITYPVVFSRERSVAMTGQAYFKVKFDRAHPFFTHVKGVTLKDLGTEFNVNAYDDESAVRATLAEGRLQVNALVLKPGEQSDGLTKKTVDVAPVIAWKNGDFDFRDADIKTIMRQLSRWYAIDVSYQEQPTTARFNAQISRKQNISVILNALERTGGVRFIIEGRRVTVIE